MSNSSDPGDRQYHAEHTWIMSTDGEYIVGITAHAQEELGDVVYVQAPEVGASVTQGAACGVIESVKTAADLHAPASGVVTAVNPALADHPELLNAEPYGAWIFRMKLVNAGELTALMDATAYGKQFG